MLHHSSFFMGDKYTLSWRKNNQCPMSAKTVLIAGASGLVGNKLLNLLTDDSGFEKITIITRKPLGIKSEKVQEIILNFDELNKHAENFSAGTVFCCLGTTIRTAGSQENFRKVDFTYCVELAKAAKARGVKQFILISSVGADAKSSNFYLRTKGETENAIAGLDFENFCILRPSMLLGDRKEQRPGESMGKYFMQATGFLFLGPLKKYKAIEAATVARCMSALAKNPGKGKVIFEGEMIAFCGK